MAMGGALRQFDVGRTAREPQKLSAALIGRTPPARLLVPLTLVLAFALRLTVLGAGGSHHQDEIFQYVEQAHRLLFGWGIVPWEYRYGIRSWLPSLLIAGPMWAGHELAPATGLYLLLPGLMMVALSTMIVGGAAIVGRRISPLAGLFAGVVTAIWAELIHFAPLFLTEAAATALIVGAMALILRPAQTIRSAVAAGLLLGFAGLLRFHYLPAIGVLAVLGCPRARWLALAAGMVMAGLLSAGVDLAMGQTPFAWIVENVRQNLVLNRSARYGTDGPLVYLKAYTVAWGAWWPAIVGLALLGARRLPLVALVAVVNLAVHMAIAHKEYRFVFLSTTLLILLAAVGTAQLVGWLAERRGRSRLIPALALASWGVASLMLAESGRTSIFDRNGGPPRQLIGALRHDPALCGLATARISLVGGGYSLLHRPVPIYAYPRGETAAMARNGAAFNRLVMPLDGQGGPPAGFAASDCRPAENGFPAACIFSRPGGCAAGDPDDLVNRVLIRRDQ